MLARLSPESPPERGREREREREPEPEECTLFVLEHHHERLPYLGHGNTYKGHDVVPATWRHLLPLRDETRIPFAHDESVYARWEEICFKECERLYAIQTDTRTLLESWAFMESKGFAWGRWMEDVRRGVSEAEEKLYEQRELVAGLFLWAVGECPSCLDSSGEE
ncbi:hypothetical protein GGR50DRAFT_650849 [Xylaria sp. CBS 124048]|nr:hypothetical protein GGR50DRAFT_650849 [Xylaria sp. CBS 124048]